MSLRIYAINLDRSIDRWNVLSRQAEALGLPLSRVPGHNGAAILPEDRIDCDMRAFERNNGRTILPGEYGCYRSHLEALAAFYQTGEPVGVIVEDDIELSADLLVRAGSAVEALPEADVIKLFNHRIVGFKRAVVSRTGDEIGRTMHGPQGSAACYVVTHLGAERLIEGLKIMEYPWDVALERGWASGVRIYTTRQDVASPTRDGTTIATQSAYRASKFPWWKRLRTYGIRIVEAARRIAYVHNG
ncbi:glycosyltransferase family 25 protein [Shinella zoogloeoides]|uniref:glycosyltransferase family 25 protein n=1 Tax=Shinella zoogloeoides TaxID=352475 RepID=UPI001F55C6DE|nr:glycosyltransferase family 25 protein [Shinella zoogloeoides]